MGNTVGVSVLFTDLVGSTALASELGAGEAENLRQVHFGILREAVEGCGGREVKNLGDGVMAVFPGAASALDAGIAVQQAVARHNRSGDGAAIAIRIGVATGDCTEDDGDYFGEPVVQAARLCARAGDHEILATAVFRYLVPREGYDLDDVGELELKGLPEPVSALRVNWSPPDDEVSAALAPLPVRLTVEHLAGLVGRDQERRTLDHALKAATAGERRVVLITGEAGLGKTRLTAEFARAAHENGTLVLYGRCDEELAVPYLPWIEALGHWVDHTPTEELVALDDACRSQLVRLLPALQQRLADAGVTTDPAPADQYALVAAVTRLLATVAAATPVLVVLDDLHWADDASLLLLRQVATSLPDASLMFVGTYRDTDLAPDDALTDTSARLHRLEGVHRISLAGLSDIEVVRLLEAAAGHEIDERGVALAHSLRADSAGNPFFVVEMLRHLAEAGAIALGDDGRWTVVADLENIALPQSVRDVVGQRVRRLGGQAHSVLTAGAVMGREFDGPVVAGATELDEDDVLDVLEEAMAAGLIAEVADADERYTFTHALVQHTLYSELSDTRRARMHRRVAAAIEELVGDHPGNRVGELAKHWFAAVRPAELDRAISYAVRAGQRALEASAPDEAARWFAQALEALDDDEEERRCEVELRLGEAERRAGRPAFRERLLAAAGRAQQLGRDDVLVEAAICNYRGLHSVSGDVDAERIAVLEAALASPAGEQPANRARLLATLAGELAYSDDQRRFGLADDAAALARQTEDREVLVDALERVGGALNIPRLIDLRDARTLEALALTDGQTDPVRRFYAVDRRTLVSLERADMDGARKMAAERAAIAEQLGEPGLRWLAVQGTALLDLVEGDLERAGEGTGRALELALETGQPDASVYFGALMLQMLWHQGKFEDTIPVVRKGIEDNPGVSAYRPVLAVFSSHAGHHDDARAVVDELAAQHFDFPRDLLWITSTVFAAEAVHLAGHVEGATVLHDRLLTAAGQVAATRITCSGPVSYVLGLLASTLGRAEEAERHHRAAIEQARGLRSPFHRVRPMLALAELVRSDAPDEFERLVAEATELVERFAIAGVAHQLHALTD